MNHRSDMCPLCEVRFREKAQEECRYERDTPLAAGRRSKSKMRQCGNKSAALRKINRVKLCEELAPDFYTVSEIVKLCGRSRSKICGTIRRWYHKECPKIQGQYFVPKSLLIMLARDLDVQLEEVVSRAKVRYEKQF
jgi:hypothetical protein